ncbi:hypothetical protein GTO89_01980 [Heliobacterium gestii]|uniref:Uncharacterized protein n=1 Tax=Heliomicrobium gestii TaxID=2699 RepID=A0A845LAW2_HELGE|nr:hypothetical protein [Heliomicrobium gestii]MBM7865548.1 hypothetical protein [Heliomicrobium gestii]MZP41799.1 hypothetical protein [Heliomicrobium gestii]
MNLTEHLKILDVVSLRTIAINLNLGTPPDATAHYYRHKIKEALTNIDTFRKKVFHRLSDGAKQELLQWIFCSGTRNFQYEKEFFGFGLTVQEGSLPKDLRDMLSPSFRHLVVEQLQTPKSGKCSAFMQLILLIHALHRYPPPKPKKKESTNSRKKRILDHYSKKLLVDDINLLTNLLNYLDTNGFINSIREPNITSESNLLLWLHQKKHKWIFHFYKWLFQTQRLEYPPKVLTWLSDIQVSEQDWVRTTLFQNNNEHLPVRDWLTKWGLLRFTRYDENEYIQLTPDAWFLMNNEVPRSWKEQSVLVSAAREIFSPHSHDPFVIASILTFSELKANEYLLVFELDDPLNNKHSHWYSPKDLYEALKTRARRIPSAVDFELINCCVDKH